MPEKPKFCKQCGLEFFSSSEDQICLNCQMPGAVEPLPSGAAALPRKSAQEATKKILLVDDDPDMLKLLRARLEKAGYHILEARDGEEGLFKIQSERPDLVVLDVLMPGMTGYEMLKCMKREAAPIRKTPVIVMTGKRSMKDFFSPTDTQYLLFKPFEPDELMAKIKEVLEFSAASD